MNESIEQFEIDDDDYIITDCGALGCNVRVNRLDGQFLEMDDALIAIKDDMEREQFWPNVWYVNDHGNASLINMSEA